MEFVQLLDNNFNKAEGESVGYTSNGDDVSKKDKLDARRAVARGALVIHDEANPRNIYSVHRAKGLALAGLSFPIRPSRISKVFGFNFRTS